MQLNSFIGNQ
jgi:hypothetical protein